MKQPVSYKKLSKKEQRKIDLKSRTVWEINPVTRRPENPKAYNRAKSKANLMKNY